MVALALCFLVTVLEHVDTFESHLVAKNSSKNANFTYGKTLPGIQILDFFPGNFETIKNLQGNNVDILMEHRIVAEPKFFLFLT